MSYRQLYLHPIFRENRDVAKEIYDYVYADIIGHRKKSKKYRDFIKKIGSPRYKTFKKFRHLLKENDVDNIPMRLLGFGNYEFDDFERKYTRNIHPFYCNGEICNNTGNALKWGEYEAHKYHSYSKTCNICYANRYICRPGSYLWKEWWTKETRSNATAKYNELRWKLIEIEKIDPNETINLYEAIMELFNAID